METQKDVYRAPTASRTQRWYGLVVLTLVYALNQADRFVMSSLLEPIKADLDLSDASAGMLSGVALALFYVTAGLPIAAWADRANRRNIVAASLAIWSGMTALCGLTKGFFDLLLVRIGVGVGEAGGTAPSHAMLSDLFPPRQRARALAIYGIGVSIGVALASFGGSLSEHIGWRAVFFVLGIPGILLAIAIMLTVPEPVRGAHDSTSSTDGASLIETGRFVWSQATLRHQMIAAFLSCLSGWGLIWWLPSYLQRSFGFSTSEAGNMLGSMHLMGGTAGLLASVALTRALESKPSMWLCRVAALILGAATIPAVVAVTTHNPNVLNLALWAFIVIVYALYGPIFALMQNSTPPGMRSQISAIGLLVINVGNLVVAPLAVGFASDLLRPTYQDESLRFALIPLALIGFWGSAHYWWSSRTLEQTMAKVGTY